MEIRGSAALVTGGGSGLGEATARELAARGARVGILDLERSNGAAVAEELGDAALFLPADVTDEAGVSAAVERVRSELGTLRVVVSCAGIGTPGRVVDKQGEPLDLGRFRQVIEVNLIGTFNVLRLAAARMRENEPTAEGERGVVVNDGAGASAGVTGGGAWRRTRPQKPGRAGSGPCGAR